MSYGFAAHTVKSALHSILLESHFRIKWLGANLTTKLVKIHTLVIMLIRTHFLFQT